MFLCRLGVRTKAGVNMDSGWELPQSRLTKETRNGPGNKFSSQKCPPQFSSGTAPMSGKLTSCPVNLTKPSSYFGYNFSSWIQIQYATISIFQCITHPLSQRCLVTATSLLPVCPNNRKTMQNQQVWPAMTFLSKLT